MATKTKAKPAPVQGTLTVRLREVREVTIQSEADLDAALAELGVLAATQAGLDADFAKEIEPIKQKYQLAGRVIVGSEKVPIADRAGEILAACKLYCSANRKAILGDSEKKSREFTHGKVSWRDDPPGLATIDGAPPETWLDKIAEKVLPKFNALLAGLKVAGKLCADQFIDVDIRWAQKRILASHGDKKISDEQLGLVGWKVKDGQEQLTIKPATLKAEAHSEK